MSKHHDKQQVDSRWRVEIDLTKEGDDAVATADLFLGDEIYEAHGHAPRDSFSRSAAADELAIARALSGLAHQLVDDASREVGRLSGVVSRQALVAEKAYAEIEI